ncbi:hypothetical protein QYE76_041306 [Lolium multiflorum]|uniref:Retrotransposon gag domain-containing protein n=1 Tax=Lolium multiflorum TaxID=4521 RepID=A0AAD8TEH7_LOLMU|nr:hypothetical protein QYE76_041306 [Lolium multiflorum]
MGLAAASLEGFPYRGSRYGGFATKALSRRKGGVGGVTGPHMLGPRGPLGPRRPSVAAPVPLPFPSVFWKLRGKIVPWALISSNSENISFVGFLKPKTAENNNWRFGILLIDCLNRLEEDNDDPEGAEVIGYEEPDLSGGVEANYGKFTFGTTRGICRERRVRRVKHSASSVRPRQKEEADEAARNQFPPPPPPMTQQNFLQYMQMLEERQRVTMEQQNKFFQELLQQNRVERPENQGVTLSDFQNTKPISFAYAPEPMDAEDWLMDTERKLNTVGCNDLEKVRYATHLLCGPAASWWDNIVAVYPAERCLHGKSSRGSSGNPMSLKVVELKRREFESLEQKDKAILTYVREFSGLSRYAVEEVNTEDKKKKRFMRGLNPQFKVQLRMLRATEFQELVDAAITLEDDFKQLQDEKRKKAKFEPKRFVSNKPNMGLSFKPRYNNNNNSNRNQAFRLQIR